VLDLAARKQRRWWTNDFAADKGTPVNHRGQVPDLNHLISQANTNETTPTRKLAAADRCSHGWSKTRSILFSTLRVYAQIVTA
jgi:hypothetical protein